jgi:hypothetical protein
MVWLRRFDSRHLVQALGVLSKDAFIVLIQWLREDLSKEQTSSLPWVAVTVVVYERGAVAQMDRATVS